MNRAAEGPCSWCGAQCRSIHRLCQKCSIAAYYVTRRTGQFASNDSLVGGRWVPGKGGIRRWVPEGA